MKVNKDALLEYEPTEAELFIFHNEKKQYIRRYD